MSKKPIRIYRVSLANLTGSKDFGDTSRTLPSSPQRSTTPTGRTARTLPAINVNDSLADREPETPSPTLLEYLDVDSARIKLRVDTISTDSGFHNGPYSVSSNNSPPPSPS